MAAAMNWLDYLLLLIIVLSIIHGLAHGALRMLTSIFSFILGIYAALTWHSQVAALVQAHLGASPFSSELIGWIAIFLLVFALVEIAGQRIIALAALVHLNLVDRLAGAALGAVLGVVFSGINIVLLTALLPANYPLLQNSALAPRILSYDQKLVDYVPPQLRQAYQDKRNQLAQYWNDKNKNPATTADSSR